MVPMRKNGEKKSKFTPCRYDKVKTTKEKCSSSVGMKMMYRAVAAEQDWRKWLRLRIKKETKTQPELIKTMTFFLIRNNPVPRYVSSPRCLLSQLANNATGNYPSNQFIIFVTLHEPYASRAHSSGVFNRYNKKKKKKKKKEKKKKKKKETRTQT